jgi:hypothetical protein
MTTLAAVAQGEAQAWYVVVTILSVQTLGVWHWTGPHKHNQEDSLSQQPTILSRD